MKYELYFKLAVAFKFVSVLPLIIVLVLLGLVPLKIVLITPELIYYC